MTSSPVPASSGAPALELKGITKRFGSVVANDRVDFDVRAGEVHALLGHGTRNRLSLEREIAIKAGENLSVIEGQRCESPIKIE